MKAAIGTGVNAGVSILFHLIFWISHDDVQRHLNDSTSSRSWRSHRRGIHGRYYSLQSRKIRSHTHLSGCTEVVKLLLEHGVVTQTTATLTTPLVSLVEDAALVLFEPYVDDGSRVHAFEQVSRLLPTMAPTQPFLTGRGRRR